MTDARWISQRFAPDGGSASDGIRKQLGVPVLDPLAVLIREAAQNCWAASDNGKNGTVVFSVSIDQLTGKNGGV